MNRLSLFLLLAFVAALTSCTPPPTCPKTGGRIVPTSLFALEGAATKVVMDFPAPAGCALPEGTFLVSGEFIEADGTTHPFAVDSQRHDQAVGVAHVTVSFTPRVAGLGELKVFVDPQLGIAQIPVLVARDGARLPSFEVPCATSQASALGHHACATSAGVALWFGATQVTAFTSGLGPQIVENLLWLEVTDGGERVVERHLLLADGGVELLDRSEPFRPGNAHARYADEQRTFRAQHVAIARDGGIALVPQRTVPSSADTVVAEANRAWTWTTDRWCLTDGGCLASSVRTRVAGINPEGWWDYTSPLVVLRARPFSDDAGARETLELTTGLTLSIGQRDVQRTFRPTWADPDLGQLVLERLDGGGVLLTRFPPAPVTFQNDALIGFGVDGGTRFFRLR